jgi:hypothetical protein
LSTTAKIWTICPSSRFTQKYEVTYDFTLPDAHDSQRLNLLKSLEHLAIDVVEKVISKRLSSIKVTCGEYQETSLSKRKLSNQQKLEQTVEERACYLTHESAQFATLYKKFPRSKSSSPISPFASRFPSRCSCSISTSANCRP